MVLGLDSGVIDESSGVCDEAAHGASDVGVDLQNLFDGGCFHERRGDSLLHCQHHALGTLDSHGSAAQLDGLDRVLHLKQPPVATERVHVSVVPWKKKKRRGIRRRKKKKKEGKKTKKEKTGRLGHTKGGSPRQPVFLFE